ncbi:MAG: hypothetical protein K2P78_04300, partial [Gemmataceae bacterium]|nr:hypothetical protein [Gemmataceae bacterium]
VTRIADDAAARRDDLAAVLDAHRITVPPPGAFPLQFTDLNFIAVRALVPKLRDDLRRELTALEADESAAADPAAAAALRALTDAHRKHLADLDAAARG